MQQERSMDEQFIDKLISIIDINLNNEKFGVSQLADEASISRAQLHRKLNTITGKSSSQFLREYRLEKAMELLKSNSGTASEIAYRVGFSSPTYFNTSFTNYYGYPPGEVKFQNAIAPPKKTYAKKLAGVIPIIILIGLIVVQQVYQNKIDNLSNLSFTDDEGNQKELTVLKEKYRTTIPVFNFVQETVDSSKQWIEWAISDLLYEDMIQDINTSPMTLIASSTSEKIELVKSNSDIYVDGSYNIINGKYFISPTIRNSTTGKIIEKRTFEGPDLLDVLDSISIYLRDAAGIDQEQRNKYADLPLKEHLSSNMEAIKYYVLGLNGSRVNWAFAIEKDTTFAKAHKVLADFMLYWNNSMDEVKVQYNQAYKYRKKLPYNDQYEIILYRHMANQEWDKAEKLAKLQLEASPKNDKFQMAMHVIYAQTGRMKEKLEFSRKNYNLDASKWNTLVEDLLVMEEYEEAIELIDQIDDIDDNERRRLKIKPYILKGDYDLALKNIEEFNLLNPEKTATTKVFIDAINYQKNTNLSKTDLTEYECDYITNSGQGTGKIWATNNKLYLSHSNQPFIQALILSGEDEFVHGFPGTEAHYKKLVRGRDSVVYGFLSRTNRNKHWTNTQLRWNVDNNMTKAQHYLISGEYKTAESYYNKAIKDNPNHEYLKDQLKHVQYMMGKSEDELLNQYQDITGNYGSWRVWLENGHLYLTRRIEARLELRPISKTKYLILLKPGLQIEFDYQDEQAIGVFYHNFNVEEMQWQTHSNEDSGEYNIKN